MVHAAIEITPGSIRTRAVDGGGEPGCLVDRFVPVPVEASNIRRVEAILADAVAAAREVGADRIEVSAAPEMRGDRVLALIGRSVRGPGIGPVQVLDPGSLMAGRFLAATRAISEPNRIAVVGLGHHSVGLAVGLPGSRPEWVGSRPVGLERIHSRARLQDPPTPVQVEAAVSATIRSLASLHPPRIERLLVVSDFADQIAAICGSPAGESEVRAGLDSMLGMTADELAASTGRNWRHARLLVPATVAHLAVARLLELPLEPVEVDPAAALALVAGESPGEWDRA